MLRGKSLVGRLLAFKRPSDGYEQLEELLENEPPSLTRSADEY